MKPFSHVGSLTAPFNSVREHRTSSFKILQVTIADPVAGGVQEVGLNFQLPQWDFSFKAQLSCSFNEGIENTDEEENFLSQIGETDFICENDGMPCVLYHKNAFLIQVKEYVVPVIKRALGW